MNFFYGSKRLDMSKDLLTTDLDLKGQVFIVWLGSLSVDCVVESAV